MIPLAGGLLAALSLTTAVWIASLLRRDASLIDIFWGPGFVLLAWIYTLGVGTDSPRGVLVAALVTLWGLRLATHIAVRGRGRGEDYRYAAMRQRWGGRFGWVSLFTVFWLQGGLMWLLSVPLYRAAASPDPAGLTWIDALAVSVFAVGLTCETVADLQLVRFKADPANGGRVLTHGLWRYSRHPNYFGDALVWWGLWLFALATPGAAWTIYSPALMTLLLMRVSGVPLLERHMGETKPGYRDYVDRTSAFLPWFPRRTRETT